MVSQKQLVANRKNAVKSTGPKTAKGKAKVAQNAITHGLTSRQLVIHGLEREEDWLEHRDRVLADLQPKGYLEEQLAESSTLNSFVQY